MSELKRILRRARPRDLWARLRTRPRVTESLSVSGSPPSELIELEHMAVQEQALPLVKWWHYFAIYERHLGSLARASRMGELAEPVRILEIGVLGGGSLELWSRWFGPHARIVGVDVDPSCSALSVKGAQVRIGSQDDSAFLNRVVDELGGVDVVIDDGNHTSRSVTASLKTLFPRLSPGGLYFIEDLHASYWPSFGGGLHRRDSSIEQLKSTVDSLHQPYFGARCDEKVLGVPADQLRSVSFYDSMAVLEKQERRSTFVFRSNLNSGSGIPGGSD